MPSLDETLALVERLEKATADARAVLSETHGATKDLRAAKREVEAVIATVKDKAEKAVSDEIIKAIKKDIEISTKGIHNIYKHVIEQFDVLAGPLYESLGLIRTSRGMKTQGWKEWLKDAESEWEAEKAGRSQSPDIPR